MFELNIYDREYSFDLKKKDYDFIKKFEDDYHLQRNYKIIEHAFNQNGDFCENFIIYDKDILSNEFLENFQYGMNNRWHNFHKCAFDPAINFLIHECCLTAEELKLIQKTLIYINNKYGKEGLEKIRGLYFAGGMAYRYHCIEVLDIHNQYDLPYLFDEYNEDGYKEIMLDKYDYSPFKRIDDALNSKVFINYHDENVKSALFSIPHLLYNEDGSFISNEEIFILLNECSTKLKSIIEKSKTENYSEILNDKDYESAINIYKQIYRDRELYKYKKTNKSLSLKK